MIRRDPDEIRHEGGTVETASPATGALSTSGAAATAVFLSYNRRDSGPAEHIANALRDAGLDVFFDRWTLEAGEAWTGAIEQALNRAAAVIVILGPSGMGDWQRAESDLALDRQRRDGNVRVVPVLLRGADPPLGFLRLNSWVDLSAGHDDLTLLQHLVEIVRGGKDGRAPGLCPYRGLRPFRQEDAAFFFGRDEFVARVSASVRRKNVTAVAGASGSGKSSAIHAGLLPRLRADPAEDWTFVTLRPGREPFHALAANVAALKRPFASEAERLQETRALGDSLRDGSVSMRDALAPLTAESATRRVLLFIDQWEELYTTCDDAGVRTRFIDALLDSAGDRISVLFTVRGDYFDDVLEHRPLADRLQGAIVNIGPMTEEELRACIEEPARKVQLSFEDGLVDSIIADVAGEPGSLPLLEFVLMELWERRRGPSLTAQAYAAIGGLRGAIADRAEGVLASFGPDSVERTLVQHVMLELVSVASSGHTRRRATRSEIGEEAWRVVPALADERLLVTSHDDATGEETAEVAHEALIRHWDRLRKWLDEDREFLLWHQRLRASIESFDATPDDDGTLLRGSLLQEAVRWRDSRQHRLPAREIAFIRKSERRARHLRLRRYANASFIGLALGVLALGGWRFQSIRLRNLAMRDAAILEAAAAERDPLIAALLVAELDPSREPPSGARIARLVADRAIPTAVLATQGGTVISAQATPDGQHIIVGYDDGRVLRWDVRGGGPDPLVAEGDPLRDARLDAGGRQLVLLSESGAVRLLDIQDAIEVRPWGGTAPEDIALARVGAGTVITASHDGLLTVWPIRGGGEAVRTQLTRGAPRDILMDRSGNRIVIVTDSLIQAIERGRLDAPTVLRGHRENIATAGLSGSGTTLLTGSYDGSVRLWDVETRASIELREADGEVVWSVALDTAGQRYAFAAADGLVCDGAVAHPTARPACHSHAGEATLVAFSPDGRTVLSGGAAGEAYARPSGTTGLPVPLGGHRAAITHASFSSDGGRIITTSGDGEMRVWSGTLRADPVVAAAADPAAATAVTPDGRTVVLAGYRGSVRVLDMEAVETLAWSSAGSPSAIAIDASGKRVAAGMSDGRVWVRDADAGRPAIDLAGHQAYVTSVAFDDAGDEIVSASADSTVRVWSGPDFSSVRTISGHADLVNGAVFNHSASLLLTWSDDGTARVWPAAGQEGPVVMNHGAPLRHAAFSPAGDVIATASQDGAIGIWSNTGDSLQTFHGHEGAATHVTFDARGRRVASASADLTARIWTIDRSQPPAVLRGHRKHVRTVRFNADGSAIVTASLDSTARVFVVGQPGDAITLTHGGELRDARFSGDGSRVLTIGEDGRVLRWRVTWAALHDYLAAATAGCLAATDRVRFLGEADDDAADREQACINGRRTSAHEDGV